MLYEILEACSMLGVRPVMTQPVFFTDNDLRQAVQLQSGDIRDLVDFVRQANGSVIMFWEYMLKRERYVVDLDVLLAETQPCVVELLRDEIEQFNAENERMIDFSKPVGAIFYTVIDKRFIIQNIRYNDITPPMMREADNFLSALKQSYSERIVEAEKEAIEKALILAAEKEAEAIKIAAEKEAEAARIAAENEQKSAEREELLAEFREFVIADPYFVKYSNEGHRRDYAREVFLARDDTERFRTLFYAPADTTCSNYDSKSNCFYFLQKIYIEITNGAVTSIKKDKRDANKKYGSFFNRFI